MLLSTASLQDERAELEGVLRVLGGVDRLNLLAFKHWEVNPHQCWDNTCQAMACAVRIQLQVISFFCLDNGLPVLWLRVVGSGGCIRITFSRAGDLLLLLLCYYNVLLLVDSSSK